MAKVEKVDEATMGTVLSAFYWGYAVSQVGLLHTIAVPSLKQQSSFHWAQQVMAVMVSRKATWSDPLPLKPTCFCC